MAIQVGPRFAWAHYQASNDSIPAVIPALTAKAVTMLWDVVGMPGVLHGEHRIWKWTVVEHHDLPVKTNRPPMVPPEVGAAIAIPWPGREETNPQHTRPRHSPSYVRRSKSLIG